MKQSPRLNVICPQCDLIQHSDNKCKDNDCRANFRFETYDIRSKPYYELKDENDKTIKPRA